MANYLKKKNLRRATYTWPISYSTLVKILKRQRSDPESVQFGKWHESGFFPEKKSERERESRNGSRKELARLSTLKSAP